MAFIQPIQTQFHRLGGRGKNAALLLFASACLAQAQRPEPANWFVGDMHVHRSCGDAPVSLATISNAMVNADLSVVSLLADMGNGEVQNPTTDLPLVNGLNSPSSPPNRILHWDAEWHWDATYYQFAHQALGGHVVALGLTNAQQIWREYTWPVIQWAKARSGISGFAHMQYLPDNSFPQTLNCCLPMEYPVEVALGGADFISQDVAGADSAMLAYYRLLNCGFRPGWAAGSDYPCNAQIGALTTFVKVDGTLTYRKWIEGIRDGRTVISRNGRREFLDLKVNTTAGPGDTINLPAGGGTVQVSVQWSANTSLAGNLEIIHNGNVVTSKVVSASLNNPTNLTASIAFTKSGWIAARRMGGGEHQSHTAAVFVSVDNAPVRASAGDAQFYVNWINELLTRTSTGGVWASYFTTNRAEAHARYQAARDVFQQIAAEAGGTQSAPTPVLIGNGAEPVGSDPIWDGGAWINAARFQAVNNSQVSVIYANVGTIAGKYKCAIYAGTSSLPGAFLRSTAEVTGPGEGWKPFALTSPLQLTQGSYYWLAIWSDDPNGRVFYSDSGGTLRWQQQNYGAWPGTLSTTGGGDHNYCIYATDQSLAVTNLTVAPTNATVWIGDTQQYTAIATYSDGSPLNVTAQANWSSSNAAVATINSVGLATGVASGSTMIAATFGGMTGAVSVAVAPVPYNTGDYRSAATGNWSSTSTWQRFNGSAWVAAASSPTSANAGVVSILSNHVVTVNSSVTVDQVVVEAGGQLTVAGVTLTVANGVGTDLEVRGTLATSSSTSSDFTLNSGATIVVSDGGIYQHARNGGTVPTANWHTNSTCEISGMTSSYPGGMGQDFGHVVFNSNMGTSTTATVMATDLTTLGNLTLATTGTRPFHGTSSSTARTIAVGGNFIVESASFFLKAGSGDCAINVTGDFVQSGGAFTLRSSSTSGSGTVSVAGSFSMAGGSNILSAIGAMGTLNVAGHFSHTGGVITETSTGSGSIVFNGAVPQVFTSGGTVSQTINFTVNDGAFLQMVDAGTVVTGGGAFTLSSGAGLGITSPNGITSGTGTGSSAGNIRTSGGRTFSTGAHYIYNGATPQVTGSGLPAALAGSGSVTIANPAGVALSANLTGSGPGMIATNGLLASGGSIAGPLTLSGTVAPGTSPGTFTSGAQTWNGGGTYVWEINNATGAAGSGYDRLNATSAAITIAATAGNPFTLKLVSLNGASPGPASNFNLSSNYTWTIASGSSISGFATNKFIIDASAFQNDIGSGWFSVEQSGGNLLLRFNRRVEVATTSLPTGATNTAYSATLTASGGLPPFNWSLAAGSLPPGLTLNSGSGLISGTPTTTGVFNFTAQVTDSSAPPGAATRPLNIAITLPPPILVLTNAANPFTGYYSEILLTEGLNAFAVSNISSLTASTLAPHDVVILGEMTLTTGQVTTLSNWVVQGGNLIAMRPDKKLAGLLGLADLSATLSEGYLRVNTASAPGAGIVSETMQYHGVADRYALGSAASVATLYSNSSTATTNPAVTLRTVGSSGGQAAAFVYDLARSVALTRQGNPAWVGQERDGFAPLRSSDLFFPDWIDFNKVAIPQADEQQRLLANLILQMNADRKQQPRFWYFPDEHKAAVVMTGDDHANNGTANRFDQYLAYSGTNAWADDWKTIRGTSYIFPNTVNASPPLTDAQAAAYHAAGFEIGLHCDSGCANYTAATLQNFFTSQLQQLANNYPSLPPPTTHRMHCIAWSGYTILPEVGRQFGIRLDTSYYYWPSNWVLNRPGMFTGSGMPMRFATTNGATIDVYQAATQMTDESGQSYPFTSDTLLDRALGAEGYYGFFVANMHTDVNPFPQSDALVVSAMNRGVPVITARQLLKWLDGRNGSVIRPIQSATNSETFHVSVDAAARGLQVMVPVRPGKSVAGVTFEGGPVGHALKQVKGMTYAQFPAATGVWQIDFVPDIVAPAIVSTLPANGESGVSVNSELRVTFSEAMDPATINTNSVTLTDASANSVPLQVSYNSATFEAVAVPMAPLQLARTYTAAVAGGGSGVKDISGNALTTGSNWNFTTINQVLTSIWPPSAVPELFTDPDTNSTAVGVKFRSDTNGFITAIRYYRGPSNPGPHVGSLWTSGGGLLASVTFSNETSSGWQEQALNSPVAIASNTTYVVSYHAPNGGYSTTPGYFATKGATNPPLRALSNAAAGGNGVYRYGPPLTFPNQTFNSENYWVDVVFSSGAVSNNPPTAGNLVIATPEDTATNSFLPGNDVEGPVAFSILTNPTHGLLSGFNASSGAFTYTPALNYNGPDAFTYRVSDGSLFATGLVSITVSPVNDAPVFASTPTNRIIPEMTLLIVTNTATDVDLPPQTLGYSLVNPPAGAAITNGVITWMPGEAQGPSTNEIITVVSDGVVSVTNSFTVTVTEVNMAPVFAATPTNRTIPEETLLTVTNTASDADVPAQALVYSLINPPAGAAITNGVITWTPTEAQGPSTNMLTTVVSDGVVNVTNTFTVIVTEVNEPPAFAQNPPDIEIAEHALLTVTNIAIDPDLPANELIYNLLAAPEGALISSNGIVTWIPNEAQGPGTNAIVAVVSDGEFSATNQFTVIVTEVNEPPVFVQTPPDVTVVAGTMLTVTNAATDADLPVNLLSYSLLNPPMGADISPTGVITWTPESEQAPGTNWLVTSVSDGLASATNSFEVRVMPQLVSPVILSLAITNGDAIVTWSTTPGYSYLLESATNVMSLDWTPVSPLTLTMESTMTVTNAIGDLPLRLYRVRAE